LSTTDKKITVTAALPYANGPLHIGHIAGAYLPSDIYVRYLRSVGRDVAFICGSDEHGAAITLRAKKDGVSPQEIVDKYHGINQKAFTDFGIDFDIFHRTSEPIHHETAQAFFKVIEEKGGFDKQSSQQYFDEEASQFLADRYIQGTCPKCSYDKAYGDQCEKCGSTLSPEELIDPKSTLSGAAPIMKETSHWYLPMNKHEDWIREFIEAGSDDGKEHHDPKLWKNQVIGQCKSWIDAGLQPRAMTRDLDWGVKVPVEGADGKVLYVWLDAPIGYISATKAWAEEQGKDWKEYWSEDTAELVHFIGKDNIVFHCIIFPILLKLHGGLGLPENVPANEFLNLEGEKLSTSRNWAVWLHEYIERFPDQQDALRYAIASNFPENRDSEFTWSDFQAKNNNELVAVFGNFVNRAVVLTNKYFEGVVPEQGELTAMDKDVLSELNGLPSKIEAALKKYRFKDALSEMMNIARLGNKYLAESEPWKLWKTDQERVKTIMNISLQICAKLGQFCEPFLPFTSSKLLRMMNMEKLTWTQAISQELEAGHSIGTAELLFRKVENEEIDREVELLKNANAQPQVEPQKDATDFDTFQKMDIRIGEIIEAEKIKKAKKLLQLKVDTGIDVRTVVSGIAEYFEPADIIGKKVSILVNLEPRKLRGVESEGMILMGEDDQGNLKFITPDGDLPNGAIVR